MGGFYFAHYGLAEVVVPGYYLVWYNKEKGAKAVGNVVVPGYYLVWYNSKGGFF